MIYMRDILEGGSSQIQGSICGTMNFRRKGEQKYMKKELCLNWQQVYYFLMRFMRL